MFKLAFDAFVLMTLVGCATTSTVKAPWAQKLAGQTGYFHYGFEIVKVSGSQTSEYQRCEPVQILEIKQSGATYDVMFTQNNQKFRAVISRYKVNATNEQESEFFKKYFKPRLDLSVKKTISLKGRAPASSQELVCAGTIYTGMTRSDLVFVTGEPNRINRTVVRNYQQEQWIYGDYGPYYYFDEKKLTGWQD